MMTERLRQVVRQIEQLPPEEQDAVASALQRELAARAHGRQGTAAMAQLTQLRAELRHAGYPTADAVAVVRQGRDEAARRGSP